MGGDQKGKKTEDSEDEVTEMDVQGEYIKRADAIEAFQREREADIEQFGVEIPECFPAERAAGIVQFLPVFELRGCKDCRYYDSERSWCGLHSHADWPEFEPDDFCSDYRTRAE